MVAIEDGFITKMRYVEHLASPWETAACQQRGESCPLAPLRTLRASGKSSRVDRCHGMLLGVCRMWHGSAVTVRQRNP